MMMSPLDDVSHSEPVLQAALENNDTASIKEESKVEGEAQMSEVKSTPDFRLSEKSHKPSVQAAIVEAENEEVIAVVEAPPKVPTLELNKIQAVEEEVL